LRSFVLDPVAEQHFDERSELHALGARNFPKRVRNVFVNEQSRLRQRWLGDLDVDARTARNSHANQLAN
jgi:hypothetical protein